jgi:hypothetical protein
MKIILKIVMLMQLLFLVNCKPLEQDKKEFDKEIENQKNQQFQDQQEDYEDNRDLEIQDLC